MTELLFNNPNELSAYWYLLVFLTIPLIAIGRYWYVRLENITFHGTMGVSTEIAKTSATLFSFCAGVVVVFILFATGYGTFSLAEMLLSAKPGAHEEGVTKAVAEITNDMTNEEQNKFRRIASRFRHLLHWIEKDSSASCPACGVLKPSAELLIQFVETHKQFLEMNGRLKSIEALMKASELRSENTEPPKNETPDVFGVKTFLFLWLVSSLWCMGSNTLKPLITKLQLASQFESLSYAAFGLAHVLIACLIASGATVLFNLEKFPSNWFFGVFVAAVFLIRVRFFPKGA